MAENVFKLYTGSMDAAASACQQLGDKTKQLKDDLTNAETTLLFYWEGKGRNEFEKQFRLLKEQLGDISTTLMETAEKILTAEQTYLQADTDAAKALDGKNNKGENADVNAICYYGENSSGGGGRSMGGR